jgi:hypothetical protein
MKKLVLLLLSFFLVDVIFAQKIHYEKSFESALTKAATQNKLVFLEIFTPKPTLNVPQNVNFTSGLEDEEVATKFNKSFINYRVSITDTAANQFRRKYQITFFPAYLFLDKNNYLIYRDDKNSSTGKKYLDMADAALNQFSTGKNLGDYEVQYKKGKYDAAFLKEYISKREQLDLYDNAKFIDEYVNFLPISALNDYQTVLFILKAGPYVYGKSYTLAYTNRKICDSIYKTEPLTERLAINKHITNNTYFEAVKTKNAALAQQLATFYRNTSSNSKDFRQGFISSTKMLLQYYMAVKDTANYLQQASYFYDSYYMNISADSAKKLDKVQRKSQIDLLNSGKKVISADSIKKLMAKQGDKTTVRREVFSTSAPALNVANELNNAAYSFYTTGTTNPNYLSKAIIWSRRSILFNPIYGYYDTLAHLLYRYGFYAEAEVNQTLAVELAKKNAPQEAERMKKELDKIKKRAI